MAKLSFETPEFLKLVNDPSFVKKFENQKTAEDLKNLFKENGISMTDEELSEFAKSIKLANSTDTLNEDLLENVSGGKKFSEAVGDFIDKHPWLTFFAVTGAVSSLCYMPIGIIQAAKGGKDGKKASLK